MGTTIGANLSNLDAAFKQLYPTGFESLCFTDRPLLGLLPKMTEWEGANTTTRAMHIPLKYAHPSAISSGFTIAQNRAANVASKVVAWELTTSPLYGFIQIDFESMERSKGKEGAFAELKSLEVDGIVENMSNRQHQYAYGDGTGVIAQVGNSTQQASFATSTLYLLNSEDAVKIQPGDELTVAATATGSERAFGTNAHGWYVIGVNMDLGTIQVGNLAGTAVNLNDTADGIPTVANSDYICHRGDRGAVISGFQSWIPSAATGIATTGDSQFNVNRAANVDFLAGSRFDASSYGIEEGLVRGTNIVAKKGGKITEYFLNHKHYSDLVSGISARGRVDFMDYETDMPNIGYTGVRIVGAKGEVDVIPDYSCPSTLAAGFRIAEWWMASVGDLIHMQTEGDGLEFLRLGTGDGIEGRFCSYGQLVPRNPRDNINLTLPQ